MIRKFIWAFGIVVVGGAVWVAYYTYTTRPAQISSATPPPAPGPVLPAPYTYATVGNLESVSPVKVVALTPTSVTVQLSYDETRSFTFTDTIPVYSTVLVGQTGKGFGDISVGSMVTVYWHTHDPATAVAFAFPRDLALSLTAEDNAHSVAGTITSLSSSEVTLVTNDVPASQVTITLDTATKIATTVTAGQAGRGLRVGDLVVARGVATSSAKTTAKAIILPPPPLL